MLRRVKRIECASVLFITIASALVACSPTQPRYPVRGTVELDGRPMDVGEVHFTIPAKGSIELIPVRSGSFQGAVGSAGGYRVEIYSFRKPSISAEDLARLDPVARVVAQEQQNIVANGNDFSANVKPEGDNAYSFSVKSAKP